MTLSWGHRMLVPLLQPHPQHYLHIWPLRLQNFGFQSAEIVLVAMDTNTVVLVAVCVNVLEEPQLAQAQQQHRWELLYPIGQPIATANRKHNLVGFIRLEAAGSETSVGSLMHE